MKQTIWMCALFGVVLWLPLGSAALAAGAVDAAITVITEDSGPGNRIENEKPAGYNVDVVREILRRVNHVDNIKTVPWARGYLMLRNESRVALFSTTRTAERESIFKWVGPTNVNTWVLYKKKGNPLHLSSLEDAKKVGSIGVIRDDAKHKYLLDQGFTNVAPVNLGTQNPQKLQLNRIDLWLTTNLGVFSEAEKAGNQVSDFEEALVLRRNYLYIALSKDTPDETVRKWQAALDAMKKDGTYKAIMTSHPAGASALTFEPPTAAVADGKN